MFACKHKSGFFGAGGWNRFDVCLFDFTIKIFSDNCVCSLVSVWDECSIDNCQQKLLKKVSIF